MRVIHDFSGTKHRVLLEVVEGDQRAGAWAPITAPARLAVTPREGLVLVTEYSKSPVFPRPNMVYRVEELGEFELIDTRKRP